MGPRPEGHRGRKGLAGNVGAILLRKAADQAWLTDGLSRALNKDGAQPTWKKGYGFHPLGARVRNTRECLAMKLRPGDAGSNTFTDHEEVLAEALKQVPSRFRRKVIVRVDGAGASHDQGSTCCP